MPIITTLFECKSSTGQKNDPSQSLQMIERPLMTPDELKSLPKGDFIVMKTGAHPMRVHLKLFFKWGIQFDNDNPYTVPENGNRVVHYAEKKDLVDGIMKKYHPEMLSDGNTDGGNGGMGSQENMIDQQEAQKPAAHASRPNRAGTRGKAGKPLQTKAPANRTESLPIVAHERIEEAAVNEKA